MNCEHRQFAGSKYCTDERCDNYASRNLTAFGMERQLLEWVGSKGESFDTAEAFSDQYKPFGLWPKARPEAVIEPVESEDSDMYGEEE